MNVGTAIFPAGVDSAVTVTTAIHSPSIVNEGSVLIGTELTALSSLSISMRQPTHSRKHEG